MPRIMSRYAMARRRAYYLRYHYARRNLPGYRGQKFYVKQWPYVYRAMFKSKGLRRRFRYSRSKQLARKNYLFYHVKHRGLWRNL